MGTSTSASRARKFASRRLLSIVSLTLAVSLQERVSVTRRNCGFPHSVTVLITYPSSAQAPSEQHLLMRIGELQAHFPLLHARIVDAKTRSPRFEAREKPWPAREVLHAESFEAYEERAREQEALLHAENERMSAQDFDEAPMWRVSVLTSPAFPRTYLAVSAYHEIVDGMGVLLLTRALLGSSIDELPYEALPKIPALEDTMTLKPSIGYLSPIVWRELILPMLPTFLQSLLSTRPWPIGMPCKPPMECPWDVSLLSLPPAVFQSLKVAGTAHGVPTLHMILQMAYALAIWHVCGRDLEHFSVESAIPKSERDADLGHAYCTGNYISVFISRLDLAAADDFWAATAKLAAFVRSPQGVTQARGAMGMLAYIPDPAPDQKMRDTPTPTGWEKFMRDKAESPAPYGQALNVSNLGRVPLPPGAEDIVWAQCASPFISVFGVSILGHEGGLRVATIWREGAAVCREEVKRVEKVFEVVLGRLGDEHWKGSSFGDLMADL
jgi:hypothetical protein